MTAVRPLSVIICTRNRADRLPEVINQLRLQAYPEDAFEIIVVDNGSTDHTSEIVQRLAAEQGVPVRYIYESRSGITSARNRGADAARYPFLAYIDDDCTVESDWLQQLVSGFDLHERVVAVGGQVLLPRDQERPLWLAPETERWLATNSYLGAQARILDKNENIIECNMVLERKAWQTAGGFLGMEQFGSRHMAASEVLYLLAQLRRQGNKIAFVPGAVVYHHVGKRTQRWMLKRAYWQGISDGLLDYLLYRRAWASAAYHTALDLAALLVLFEQAAAYYLKGDSAKGMFHLMRAVRRFGLLLSEMRIMGNWQSLRSWLSQPNPSIHETTTALSEKKGNYV